MKEGILKILGKNKTTPAVFSNYKNLAAGALYTYRGDVFCLNNGDDFSFDDLTPNEQSKILNELKLGLFKLDKTYQG